jgi:hypothetical protein
VKSEWGLSPMGTVPSEPSESQRRPFGGQSPPMANEKSNEFHFFLIIMSKKLVSWRKKHPRVTKGSPCAAQSLDAS